VADSDRVAERHPTTDGDVDVLLRNGIRLTLTPIWRAGYQRFLRLDSEQLR
jgi:hypothetical protein